MGKHGVILLLDPRCGLLHGDWGVTGKDLKGVWEVKDGFVSGGGDEPVVNTGMNASAVMSGSAVSSGASLSSSSTLGASGIFAASVLHHRQPRIHFRPPNPRRIQHTRSGRNIGSPRPRPRHQYQHRPHLHTTSPLAPQQKLRASFSSSASCGYQNQRCMSSTEEIHGATPSAGLCIMTRKQAWWRGDRIGRWGFKRGGIWRSRERGICGGLGLLVDCLWRNYRGKSVMGGCVCA